MPNEILNQVQPAPPQPAPSPAPPKGSRKKLLASALLGAGALAFFVSLWARRPENALPPTQLQPAADPAVLQVTHPELFPVTRVLARSLPRYLTANGTVTPDVARTIHVTSLGTGRVVDLKVRLGDRVQKGQLLLLISSPDLAAALSDYQKAVADEALARRQLARIQDLFSHGAGAQKDLEAAQDAEDKAKVDLNTAADHVRLLGGTLGQSSPLIELRAPVSGTIVEQNVAAAEGIKSLDNTPNLFTIADLSRIWVICDVYENDLAAVRVGDQAQIEFNAYPGRTFPGRVSDINPLLDPATRSAKVRIELPNPDGRLMPGMFARARFQTQAAAPSLLVPQTAVMRLQDKDWVFRSEGGGRFRKLQVQTGASVDGGFQEIQFGLKAGDEIVADALQFSAQAAEEK